MKKTESNIAYIDAANLHFGLRALGWKINYTRFRVWLTEKYGVQTAYLFIGLLGDKSGLYQHLQEAGFVLIFKETVMSADGKPKGNCDAELVLQAAQDAYEKNHSKAIIVSSDGDYACLVRFLKEKGKNPVIISPSNKCSVLLKKTDVPLTYLDTIRVHLEKEKAPDADGTA